MVERYLVMVDKRNSEILVRSEVGVSLRDGHSDGVPGIGSRAGEVGEEPPIDVMDLRGPHVVLTPHRPTTGREDVALELPVHQVRGEVDREGGLGVLVRGVVGGGHGQVSSSGQSYGGGVWVVGVDHGVDVALAWQWAD